MRIKEDSTEQKGLKAISRSQRSSDPYSLQALEDLKKAGLVTPDNRLTDEGNAALSHIRHHGIWNSPIGS